MLPEATAVRVRKGNTIFAGVLPHQYLAR